MARFNFIVSTAIVAAGIATIFNNYRYFFIDLVF